MSIREKVNKSVSAFRGFFSTAVWCLRLSWSASNFYTIIRLMSEILRPLLLILLSFVGKCVVDVLTGMSDKEGTVNQILLLFSCLLFISLTRSVSQKLTQYCQSMHEDKLKCKISLLMMDRFLNADLEFFDNPKYHDKFMSANRILTQLHTFFGVFCLV